MLRALLLALCVRAAACVEKVAVTDWSTLGPNATFALFNNRTNASRLKLFRVVEFDLFSGEGMTTGPSDDRVSEYQLGFPSPKDGVASCTNDHYCVPGPCGILDINYFGNPAYSSHLSTDAIARNVVAENPYNYEKIEFGPGGLPSAHALGHSQCEPTFGTRTVFYKGDLTDYEVVDQFDKLSQQHKHAYRHMVHPDNSTDLWPNVLPLPPAIQTKADGNPNPRYMYNATDNASFKNFGDRLPYTCGGSTDGVPALYLEPVDECHSPENCTLYRVTETFNASAFIAAGLTWNTFAENKPYRSTDDTLTSPHTARQVFAQAYYSYSYEPQQFFEAYHDNQEESPFNDRDPVYNGSDAPSGYESRYVENTNYAALNHTSTVTFSPVVVGCPNSFNRRSVLAPTVQRYTDVACYADSAGIMRLPHGILSTHTKHRFATITTYPQVGISASESHPGMFSEFAQVIGIVFSPYLFQPHDEDARANATDSMRSLLTGMNQAIDWPATVRLPLWTNTSCHVFNSEDTRGSGCSMLPDIPGKVTPDCGRYEPPARDHKSAQHCKDRHGETTRESNVTDPAPDRLMRQQPPRSQFKLPGELLVLRMYELLLSHQKAGTTAAIEYVTTWTSLTEFNFSHQLPPVGPDYEREIAHLYSRTKALQRRDVGGRLAYSPLHKRVVWTPLHSFCFGGYLTFAHPYLQHTGFMYDKKYWQFLVIPPKSQQGHFQQNAGMHYTAPALDYMFAQLTSNVHTQKVMHYKGGAVNRYSVFGESEHLLLDMTTTEMIKVRYRSRQEIIDDMRQTRQCSKDAYAEGVWLAYVNDMLRFINNTTKPTDSDHSAPATAYTCGFLHTHSPYQPVHEYFCDRQRNTFNDLAIGVHFGHRNFDIGATTGCEHQGGAPCADDGTVIGYEDGVDESGYNLGDDDGFEFSNEVDRRRQCPFTDKQQTPGGCGGTTQCNQKKVLANNNAAPYNGDWQRWFCGSQISAGQCHDNMALHMATFRNIAQPAKVPCPPSGSMCPYAYPRAFTAAGSESYDRCCIKAANVCTSPTPLETKHYEGFVTYQNCTTPPCTDYQECEAPYADLVAAYIGNLGKSAAFVRDVCFLECMGECTIHCETGSDTHDGTRAGEYPEFPEDSVWATTDIPWTDWQGYGVVSGTRYTSYEKLLKNPGDSVHSVDLHLERKRGANPDNYWWSDRQVIARTWAAKNADPGPIIYSSEGQLQVTNYQDGKYERPEIYDHPVRLPHMVEGTELGSNYGFLRRAGGQTMHCSNTYFSWEPASVNMGTAHSFFEGHGARQCFTALDKDPGSEDLHGYGDDARRRAMMLTVRHHLVPEYLAYIDRGGWYGGSAVGVRSTFTNTQGDTFFKDNKNSHAPISGEPVVRLKEAGFSMRFHRTDRTDTFTGGCGLEISANRTVAKNTLAAWSGSAHAGRSDHPTSQIGTSRSLRPRTHLVQTPWLPTSSNAYGQNITCREFRAAMVTPGGAANYSDFQTNWWDMMWHTDGVHLDLGGAGGVCAGLSLGSLYGIASAEEPLWEQYNAANGTNTGAPFENVGNAVLSGRACTDTGLHTATLLMGDSANALPTEVEHADRDVDTFACVIQLNPQEKVTTVVTKYSKACHFPNNPFPGVQFAHGNLDNAFILQEFPAIVPHTGWAPSGKREWVSAIQNTERHSSFACDCNNARPVYSCNIADPNDKYVNIPEAMREGWLANITNPDHVDMAICSYSWDKPHPGTPPVGLYMASATKHFEVVETDLYHNHDEHTANPLAHVLFTDNGFSHAALSDLVFTGDARPYWIRPKPLVYNSTCLRWPYGQIHSSAFKPDIRNRIWHDDVQPEEYLHGYCDTVNSKPVYCRHDVNGAAARTAFCKQAGRLATNTVAGLVLSRERTHAQSCNYDAGLCLHLPGYGTSLASTLKQIAEDKRSGITVLVAPFGAKHLVAFMYQQVRRPVGAVDLTGMSRDAYINSTWKSWLSVGDNDTSYLGVVQDTAVFRMLAGLTAADTVGGVVAAMTSFFVRLQTPSPLCTSRDAPYILSAPLKHGYQCVSLGDTTYTYDEAVVSVAVPGTTITSAVAGVRVQFLRRPAAGACTVFHVGAPGVSITSVHVDQTGCTTTHAWDLVPFKLSGKSVAGFALDNANVVGTEVAVMVLGAHTSEFPHGSTLDVDGMFVNIVIDAPTLFIVAFARCHGNVTLFANRPAVVLEQPASEETPVHVSGGSPSGNGNTTPFTIINTHEYTSMFGEAFMQKLYPSPPQHSLFYWAAAIILLLWTAAIAVLHVYALLSRGNAGALVCGALAAFKEENGPGFAVSYTDKRRRVTFTTGHLAGERLLYNRVVAEIVFDGSTDYKEYSALENIAKNAL